MTLQHTVYEELVKREVIGDYVYDLTRIKKDDISTIEGQYADFFSSLSRWESQGNR